MKATDVGPSRIDAARSEVQTVMVRGLGGSDRMLIAQMDAAVTPLAADRRDLRARGRASPR